MGLTTHPSNSISGPGEPDSRLDVEMLAKPFEVRAPFSQYETGDGDASTWHSSCTSEPSGVPSSWLGARTMGATVNDKCNISMADPTDVAAMEAYIARLAKRVC